MEMSKRACGRGVLIVMAVLERKTSHGWKHIHFGI
jgi:hypothetical protein